MAMIFYENVMLGHTFGFSLCRMMGKVRGSKIVSGLVPNIGTSMNTFFHSPFLFSCCIKIMIVTWLVYGGSPLQGVV
jgi:hypothetical protein